MLNASDVCDALHSALMDVHTGKINAREAVERLADVIDQSEWHLELDEKRCVHGSDRSHGFFPSDDYCPGPRRAIRRTQ